MNQTTKRELYCGVHRLPVSECHHVDPSRVVRPVASLIDGRVLVVEIPRCEKGCRKDSTFVSDAGEFVCGRCEDSEYLWNAESVDDYYLAVLALFGVATSDACEEYDVQALNA